MLLMVLTGLASSAQPAGAVVAGDARQRTIEALLGYLQCDECSEPSPDLRESLKGDAEVGDFVAAQLFAGPRTQAYVIHLEHAWEVLQANPEFACPRDRQHYVSLYEQRFELLVRLKAVDLLGASCTPSALQSLRQAHEDTDLPFDVRESAGEALQGCSSD
jgi:hypothetical protein